MPDVVYLHVGPHKTGTTSLQHAFYSNTARLRRYGIHYPNTGRMGAAHQNIARACRDQDHDTLGALQDEIRDVPKVLISSELIAGLGDRGLHLLRDALDCANVQIAYTLRRLPAHWASHWKELIKHGQPFSFTQYLALMQDQNTRRVNLPPQPFRQLINLERVFGRDALRVMIYDARSTPIQDYGPNFVDDFLGLGQEADHFTTHRANVTSSDWQTELIRHINILSIEKRNYATKWAMRAALLQDLEKARPEWIAEFILVYERSRPSLISNLTPAVMSEQAKVLEKYADLIIDPIEAYRAPMTVEVRDVDPRQLPRPLRGAIESYCADLADRVGPIHTHPDHIQDQSPTE